MHCTVAELGRRMSSSEYIEQLGYDAACAYLAEQAHQRRENGEV